MVRNGTVVALACVAAACAAPTSQAPAPRLPEAAAPVAVLTDPGRTAPPAVDLPEPALLGDEILEPEVLRASVMDGRVRAWVLRLSGSETFQRQIGLMERYGPLVDERLEAHGLPASLRYLPLIESGYAPGAVSRARAVGLWQIMAPTGRALGLRIDAWIDERRHPEKSTDAALAYLAELRTRFGSWPLALLAYNGGPSRLSRLIARHAAQSGSDDERVLAVLPHLPSETREFLPKLAAAARIARDPTAFGLAPEPARELAYDEVLVPDATSLDVVARAAGVDEAAVLELNPHLVRRVTPRGVGTVVRVPPGYAAGFGERYAGIPEDRRVTIREHVIAAGETLTHVARAYGLRVREVRAANPNVDPRRLQIGQRLIVPLGPGSSGRAGETVGPRARPRHHVVVSGDTLWDLARQYGVTVDELRTWNGLGSGGAIRPGDELRVR